MKNIFKYLCFFFILSLSSCLDDFGDTNIDPNNSTTAPVPQVLTAGQGYLSWVIDSRMNGLSFLWGQYWTWGPGVSLGNAARFVSEPDDHNNLWARAYFNTLTDLQFVARNGTPEYAGAAKIMMAYTYQMLVDHFGDIPYTEALSGEVEDGSNFAPKFDNAQAIYADLLVKVDEALADLAAGQAFGAEDLIYGGDISKWIKFGNSLKLKLLMRQSVTGDQGAIGAQVTALLNSGSFIESADDIAEIDFAGTSGDENPMYADEESGIGLFYIASNASLNLLRDLNDPRIDALYQPAPNTGEIVGVNQGAIDAEPFTNTVSDYSLPSAVAYNSAASTILMSNWEVYFLRAEAAVRFGTGNAQNLFKSGIAANFDYLGVSGADAYSSALVFPNDAQIRLNQIGIQKWISMNGLQEAEGWIEARRFDTPEARIFTNGIWQTPLRSALGDKVFPAVYLYPSDELNFNPSAPAQRSSITERLFWDN